MRSETTLQPLSSQPELKEGSLFKNYSSLESSSTQKQQKELYVDPQYLKIDFDEMESPISSQFVCSKNSQVQKTASDTQDDRDTNSFPNTFYMCLDGISIVSILPKKQQEQKTQMHELIVEKEILVEKIIPTQPSINSRIRNTLKWKRENTHIYLVLLTLFEIF